MASSASSDEDPNVVNPHRFTLEALLNSPPRSAHIDIQRWLDDDRDPFIYRRGIRCTLRTRRTFTNTTHSTPSPDSYNNCESVKIYRDLPHDSTFFTMEDNQESHNAGDELTSSDHGAPADSNQEGDSAALQLEGDDGGLFGSGSEDEDHGSPNDKTKPRKLDDKELDSGDDQERLDRLSDDAGDDNKEERAETILDVKIGRHAIPRPSDKEMYLLQLPSFIGIEPQAFHPTTFQPPTTDHHSSEPPSSTFSALQTSNNTIRWRYSPNDPTKIQSNARILRWSDGSFTLQIASNPLEQFMLSAKALAPPQTNPPKPGPTSVDRPKATSGESSYNSRLDSHTYLTAPHETVSLIRTTNHITASLAVQTSSEQNDDALIRLQESLAAATKGNKTTADGGLAIINISEDPELAKKKAEVAEKEKVRAQRRRQLQEERERDRANRVLGRSGLRTGGLSAGLTVGGLEDEDGMVSTRAARTSKPKRKPKRRNSEYSDDEEDFRGRGRTKEDEYDEDDGFLVGSDEDPEILADDSEEEAEMADDGGKEDKRKKVSAKREVADESGDEGATGGRVKRRRVIEEDEDED